MSAAQRGISDTPLERKLGLDAGQVMAFASLPPSLDCLVSVAEFASGRRLESWDDFTGKPGWSGKFDVIHGFSISRADLEGGLIQARPAIKDSGLIRVSWSKRASKVATDMTEDTIREICLPMGLVDVKVCKMDEIRSGLKLDVRRERCHKG